MSGTSQVLFEHGLYSGRPMRQWVPEIVDAIVSLRNSDKIILFGSLARGSETPDSDVDLLVVLPHVANKRETAIDLRLAAAHVPVPMDIIPVSADELSAHSHQWHPIISSALEEGEVLYDRKRRHGTPLMFPM